MRYELGVSLHWMKNEKIKPINDLFLSVVDKCSKIGMARGPCFVPHACMHSNHRCQEGEREGRSELNHIVRPLPLDKARPQKKERKKRRMRDPFTPLNCATCLPRESRSSSAISGAPAGGCAFPYPIR